MSANRRQRRPELVRHRHEERSLELLRLGELRDHAAEPLAQEGDLVATARLRDLDVVATRGDLLGRARERTDGLGETPREPQEEETGERDPDRQREREPPEQRDPLLAQLGLRLRDDEPAERLGALSELHGLRSRDQAAARSRWRELDDQLVVASSSTSPSALRGSRVRPNRWPGKSDAPM